MAVPVRGVCRRRRAREPAAALRHQVRAPLPGVPVDARAGERRARRHLRVLPRARVRREPENTHFHLPRATGGTAYFSCCTAARSRGISTSAGCLAPGGAGWWASSSRRFSSSRCSWWGWRPPLAEVITSRVMGWALYTTVITQYTMVHWYSHIVRFACGVLMPSALAARSTSARGGSSPTSWPCTSAPASGGWPRRNGRHEKHVRSSSAVAVPVAVAVVRAQVSLRVFFYNSVFLLFFYYQLLTVRLWYLERNRRARSSRYGAHTKAGSGGWRTSYISFHLPFSRSNFQPRCHTSTCVAPSAKGSSARRSAPSPARRAGSHPRGVPAWRRRENDAAFAAETRSANPAMSTLYLRLSQNLE